MLSGEALQVGFILENGARLVQGTLYPGQGFVFPKNSFHYQSNTGCTPATFVAGWNHEDPGVATVGQRCKLKSDRSIFSVINRSFSPVFGIPPNVTDVTLGDIGVDETIRIAQSVSTAH